MFRTLTILFAFVCQTALALCPATGDELTEDGGRLESACVKYVGNSFSHKFHRPSCPFAKQIWPSRLKTFRFRQDAVDDDYTPCHYCLPRVWLTVHACIISKPP